jgi:hypothetical protein
MPGGSKGMPSAELSDLQKSNNVGLAENYIFDIFPNRYQFQDVKNTLQTIYDSTQSQILDSSNALQTKIRNNVIRTRLSLENSNSIPQTGTYKSDNREIGWINSGTSSYQGIGGLTGFAANTALTLYQPYGYWQKNLRASNLHSDQDTSDDQCNGGNSRSAYRTYNGEKYNDEFYLDSVRPMQYRKPELVALTEQQLFNNQGKQDISLNKKYRSVLPYIFHIQQSAQVEPSYTKVTDPTWREIKIQQRIQESIAINRKFVQTISVVFMAIVLVIASVISAAAAFFTAGASIPASIVLISNILVVLTALAAVAAFGVSLSGNNQIARQMNMFLVNPA